MRMGGEAAEQVNSIERTTKGRGKTGDPSELVGRKRTHPYEKGSRKCEAYRFNLYLTGLEQGNTKRLMFGEPSTPRDARDRQFANDVTEVMVQLGRNNKKPLWGTFSSCRSVWRRG